jgi:hypothetical protein
VGHHSRRLVRPVDVSLAMGMAMASTYWIVSPKGTASTATFRQWLLTEAEDDTRRLETA